MTDPNDLFAVSLQPVAPDHLLGGEVGAPAGPTMDENVPAWKLLIIDDDPDVHTLTATILRNFTFEGKPVRCISGYSGAEAMQLMREHPDSALLLLDVVMETELAGLEAVRFIREVLGNRFVRIIMRTGQSDRAPEKEVIVEYDINDYREKGDLSARRLITAITVGLRGYRDLRTIEKLAISNELLEERVQERSQSLMEANQGLRREVAMRGQVEIALRQSRGRLSRAQEVAHLGSLDWDLVSGQVTWSEELYRILGLPQSSLDRFSSFQALLHPDDRTKFDTTLEESLARQTPFRLEHRVVRPGGEERVVAAMGEFYGEDDGFSRHLVLTIRDITEQRLNEDHLKIVAKVFGEAMDEVSDQLRVTTMAFENALEGVMVTDPTGKIQEINPAFTRITGYEEVEAIGRNVNLLHSGRQDAAFYHGLWQELQTAGRWQGEIWSRRKNGEAYPAWLTILAIRDRQGVSGHYLGVFHDLTDIRRSQEEVRYKTFHDSLTDLPNRDLFRDRLQQAINHAQRSHNRLAVLILDLDLFKNVNSSLGHPGGDLILQQIAQRFRGVLRQEDTIARLAGDMFAFILQEVAEARDVVDVVRKIREFLKPPFPVDDHRAFITASIGIAIYPNDGVDPDALNRNAELACTRAKLSGRNNYQFYTPALGEKAARRMFLEEQMRHGLERCEFFLNYQPKVEIHTGRIIGMEALVRWQQPGVGVISPAEFIPLAEETGLIVPLGEWILRTACQESKAWLQGMEGSLRLAVNLSPYQFRHRELLRMIKRVLEETGVNPTSLELEITEGMVMEDVEGAIAIMQAMMDMGIQIAVDDFGTGYSSLNYLKRFPIHTLKIDQSFVRDLARDPDDAAIVSAIISLARNLKLNVVAEGVETREHLDFLRRNKCDEIQGYLFSRPLPAHEFELLLHAPINQKWSEDSKPG